MNSLDSISSLLLQAGTTPDRRFLFADEKINTVIVVVLVVLLGIGAYLLLTGRKVRRLEKELDQISSQTGGTTSGSEASAPIEVKRRS